MPIECKAPGLTVGPWPIWFLKCFLEADQFARHKRHFGFSLAAYLQKGEGDLIIASRAGSRNPNDWTRPGERAGFFFLGSAVPTEKKDWEYAGVAWRGPSETSLFWLSFFLQHGKLLRKEGEGFKYCWGQAGTRDPMPDDIVEQQKLIRQLSLLALPLS